MPFELTSPAFTEATPVPSRHTCDGDNLSPELRWRGAPPQTRSLALVMHDPDSPHGDFTHWLSWGIDPAADHLAEGSGNVPRDSVGRNGFGNLGYGGPCPPPGGEPHRYFFELHALDVPSLNLRRGAGRADFELALQGHVLATAKLTGRYLREKVSLAPASRR